MDSSVSVAIAINRYLFDSLPIKQNSLIENAKTNNRNCWKLKFVNVIISFRIAILILTSKKIDKYKYALFSQYSTQLTLIIQ